MSLNISISDSRRICDCQTTHDCSRRLYPRSYQRWTQLTTGRIVNGPPPSGNILEIYTEHSTKTTHTLVTQSSLNISVLQPGDQCCTCYQWECFPLCCVIRQTHLIFPALVWFLLLFTDILLIRIRVLRELFCCHAVHVYLLGDDTLVLLG
jgi:hypothetical protein